MTKIVCLAIVLLSHVVCVSQLAISQPASKSKGKKAATATSAGNIPTTVVQKSRKISEIEPMDAVPPYWYWMNERSDNTFTLRYEDGAAYMKYNDTGVLWFFKNTASDPANDWDVTMRTKMISASNRGGLGLHVRSQAFHYMFIICPAEKTYWVGHYNASTNQWKSYVAEGNDLQTYLKSESIKPIGEINTTAVRKHGDELDFLINGTVVKTFTISQTMPSLLTSVDGMGLNVSQKLEAQILDVSWNYTMRAIAYDPKAFIGATKTYATELNAQKSDRFSVLSPNGESIYWIRTDGVMSDDIMIATRATDSTWQNVRSAGFPLNNRDPNNVIAVSQDDNSLLIWNRYRSDGSPLGPGFSRTTRTSTGWTVPENVNITNYVNRAGSREECVSADRTVAILACERDGTLGDKDLYISFLQPDGAYSEPKNMGAVLNSKFSDGMPHLAADNRTLYFGSTRPGFGECDIWVSKRLDSTWLNWSEPVNLGPTINSNGWNGYLTMHPSGKYAYMNTTGPYQSGIFRLKLPQDPASRRMLPDPTVLVRGRVLNAKTLQPIATTVAIATLPDKKNTAKAASEPAQGRYSIVLPGGESYGFYASEPGYFPVSDNLDLRDLSLYREIERDLLLWPIEVGATIRLNNVFFDTNKSELRSDSREELKRLIALLNERPTMTIELGGHTDDRASDELNNKLSEDRATAVQTYLVSQGIAPNRLKAKGYGKSKPVSQGTTEAARQANRRVEFTIASV